MFKNITHYIKRDNYSKFWTAVFVIMISMLLFGRFYKELNYPANDYNYLSKENEEAILKFFNKNENNFKCYLADNKQDTVEGYEYFIFSHSEKEHCNLSVKIPNTNNIFEINDLHFK